jgi:hypothetical protein
MRNLQPTLERVLGEADRFRLSLRGVRFTLTRDELLALAASLQLVLASLARDEEPRCCLNNDTGCYDARCSCRCKQCTRVRSGGVAPNEKPYKNRRMAERSKNA